MAEALEPVPDPVLTALRPGPWTAPASAARALARELLPEESPVPSPGWLLPAQLPSFRRTVAALQRYRGALLADPLGSGKTYVALAAARAVVPRGPTICFVPATLVCQWRTAARTVGVEVVVLSHEQVSRGRLPAVARGAAIVDEAHRFRHARTRRYRHLAPWLGGRPTLLVTATPIVNRLEDLLHQLRLGIRDDALLPDGVPSLRALLRNGRGSAALGRLVIEGRAPDARPGRTDRVSAYLPEERAWAEAALEITQRLTLSRSAPVAALVRSVLRHAAASSPPALRGALLRYRRLLLHARDAAHAGRPMDRSEIRRFVGAGGDQLVLWEMLPSLGSGGELDVGDLDPLDPAIRDVEAWCSLPDAKADRLARLLADGRPSLVFVSRRETVRHLRERLGGRGIAWCTGERAGVGPLPLPRSTVLAWFREEPKVGMHAVPRHLIVTDVAAEGLDLQRAARVVHYDLPWTPMRLDQRDGRALRLGSRHPDVEIVRFTLAPALERALRLEAALRRKRALPAAAGLGPAGRRLWRWRTELAESVGRGPAETGAAVVAAGPAGVLAGFGLYATAPGRGEVRLSFALGWMDAAGRWSEDEETIAQRLATAVHGPCRSPDPERLRVALARLAGPVRDRLAAARERRWAAGDCDGAARTVSARLQTSIREAARRRDASALRCLERALGFVGGGHTAGESMLLERMAAEPPSVLAQAAARFPDPTPPWGAVEPRVSSVLLFVPDDQS